MDAVWITERRENLDSSKRVFSHTSTFPYEQNWTILKWHFRFLWFRTMQSNSQALSSRKLVRGLKLIYDRYGLLLSYIAAVTEEDVPVLPPETIFFLCGN